VIIQIVGRNFVDVNDNASALMELPTLHSIIPSSTAIHQLSACIQQAGVSLVKNISFPQIAPAGEQNY